MEHLRYAILWMILVKISLNGDIFKDLSFYEEDYEQPTIAQNTDIINEDSIRHRLLDVLWKHLLTNDKHNNLLAQVFIKDQGTLENLKERLETLLKPFAEQNAGLNTEISRFIKEVLNATQSLSVKANLQWNDIKNLLPTLQIFCKQLIDRAEF